jgi:hypothetical protein
MAAEEQGKGFEHSRVLLISAYLFKAQKLSPKKNLQQRFISQIDFKKLEAALSTYRNNPYPFEFYFEWIRGLREVAELYLIAGATQQAKKTLRFVQELTAKRGHPLISEQNAKIRNRLRELR